MKSTFYLLFTFILLFQFSAMAQDKSPAKFGNIKATDFTIAVYSLDSNASAVVLADIGATEFVGNQKGWFSLEFKRFKRIHILNQNGFEAANISIGLYSDENGNEETLDRLKAITYNWEDGKIAETKLDVKTQVFKDKINKNWVVKKFTFPNVKKGSIIEFEYTISSDFLENLQPWEFQGNYPRLWSEYNVAIPKCFSYIYLSVGSKEFDIQNQKETRKNFTISESLGAGPTDRTSFTSSVLESRWVKKNVPALKEESFTSTLENHISKIEFQLSEYRYPLNPRKIMGTWALLAKQLLESESFGEDIDKDNHWLQEIVNPLVENAPTVLEKAKRIYEYMQNNFTCTNYSRKTTDSRLKAICKKRNGNVAEINLLLTAMLRFASIDAAPAILSTRDNGLVFSMYPLFSQYNYVISRVKIDSAEILLDATEPDLGFGKLPIRCYNEIAQVIVRTPFSIDLSANNLLEDKVTNVFIAKDVQGNAMGKVNKKLGYYHSMNLRSQIRKEGLDNYKTQLAKGYTDEVAITTFKVDSLKNKNSSLYVNYEFSGKPIEEDIIYLTPMLDEQMKENPFKSTNRYYPVEMPYITDELYTLNYIIPDGYVVDEMPQSMMIKMNEEGDGSFEYRISHSGATISMRCRLQLKRAFYLTEEYEMLREFFNYVVKKQAEQVVLKKKS